MQVYMTYMYNHEDIPHNTNTPGTYRPSSNLSQTELDLQGARGVYQHFHKPHNDHTRYLTVASPTDRAAYRDLPRKLPPPWDGQVSTAKRPTSAPPSRPGYASPTKHKVDIGNATLLDNMTTLTGEHNKATPAHTHTHCALLGKVKAC